MQRFCRGTNTCIFIIIIIYLFIFVLLHRQFYVKLASFSPGKEHLNTTVNN